MLPSIQSYKAGWSTPVATLNAFVDLRPGSTINFVLPAMALNKKNHLRIVTDQSNGILDETTKTAQRALFVSYRYVYICTQACAHKRANVWVCKPS